MADEGTPIQEMMRSAMVSEEDRRIWRQYQANWLYTCTAAWAALEPPLSAAQRDIKRICAHHEHNLARRLELTVKLRHLSDSLRRRRVPGPYRLITPTER